MESGCSPPEISMLFKNTGIVPDSGNTYVHRYGDTGIVLSTLALKLLYIFTNDSILVLWMLDS